MTSATSTAAATTGARHAKQHRDASPRGVSSLMYASQQGDVDRVRKIIRAQPKSLLTRDRTGKTPLHYSCSSDSKKAAQAADILVMAAPDLVDSRDEDGFTPLHLAVIAGNMPLVTFLLANKADVNAVDNEKHTVVHWATVCGETAALRSVLTAGAPVSTPDVHGGYPLHYAAQMCGGEKDSNLGLQVLQTLLTHSDIVVSVEDGDGRQPLLWAASAGSARAVLALIRAGSGIESADKDGLTALHCAASRGHTDCIDSLLTLCGASPDVIDSNGCTALHYAVTLGHADATALLLAHGADPNRQDRKGRSPAHCGCAKGQFETVRMIGAHGANLWLRNARGDLPLHEAAASGRRDLVKWLLEMRPSQVNARNNDGRCPLHLAALNDNVDMCKILLDAGAQINPILRTSKNNFMTPLDCALQRGFRSTAKYLQLHGGVPANRLGDSRHGPPSSLNLQIRDDVTFWGDTSSDSERENGENKKGLQRKRLSRKYDKKRASLSGSDVETKLMSGKSIKLEHTRVKRRIGGDRARSSMKSGRANSGASTAQSRFGYTNEIIINGKTEINIHQTKQFTIGKDIVEDRVSATIAKNLEKKLETEIQQKLAVPDEKETRPKSAKGKPRSGKKGGTEDIPKEDNAKKKLKKPDSKKIPQKNVEGEKVSKQQAKVKKETVPVTNLVQTDEHQETVPFADEHEETERVERVLLTDQQSLMSNTSEDIEEQKNLLVEAAIHEPPKSIEPGDSKNADVSTVSTENNKVSEDHSQEITNESIHVDYVQEKIQGSGVQVADKIEVTNEVKDTEEAKRESHIVVDETQSGTKQELAVENQISDKTIHVNDQTTEKTSKNDNPSGAKTDTDDNNVHNDFVNDGDNKGVKVEASNETKQDDIAAEISPQVEDKANETNQDKKMQEVNEAHATEKIEKGAQETTVSEAEAQQAENVDKETHETQGTDKEPQGETKMISKETHESQGTDQEAQGIEETDKETHEAQGLAVETQETEGISKRTQESEGIEDRTQEGKQAADMSKDSVLENEKLDGPELTKHAKEKKNKEKNNNKISSKEMKSQRKKRSKTSAPAYEVLDKTFEDEQYPKTDTQNRREAKKSTSDPNASDESTTPQSDSTSSSTSQGHKSFRVLDEGDVKRKSRSRTSNLERQRSRSEECKKDEDEEKFKRSKIPLSKTHVSKSDKYLNVPDRKVKSSMESRVPSLPNIHGKDPPRSESNMSAPLLASIYSDRESGSEEEEKRSSSVRKKRIKKRPKPRDSRSAGSDYESSNVIDSGFEPSPRSTRIPKWKNVSDRGVNMTSVTQTIQTNIRRYHLERKIFQHLLDLKRLQIRAGQHNESILVKRAIDAYHQSCASTVGAGKYVPDDFTFKSFEKFLYLALRKLQKNGADHLKGLPESPANPLLCTQSTHRCMHATHAYTGIPCAAYLPKMDHHTIPKIGFGSTQCKPGTGGFLPNINQKTKAVTLELCHGTDKQIISLPTERLDQNKRYYVTFTVKGNDTTPEEANPTGHTHSRSD